MLQSMSFSIVALLGYMSTVFAIRKQLCRVSEDNQDFIMLYHDEYHEMLSIEFDIPELSAVVMRSPIGSTKIPSCEDIALVGQLSPVFFDWSRQEVVSNLGLVSPGDQCPNFPLILQQNVGNITLDCFFLNQGDSRITWTAPAGDCPSCLGEVDMSKVEKLCSRMKKYMAKVVGSHGKAQQHQSSREVQPQVNAPVPVPRNEVPRHVKVPPLPVKDDHFLRRKFDEMRPFFEDSDIDDEDDDDDEW